MRSSSLLLVLGSLLLLGGGAFVATTMFGEEAAPVGRWNTADEVEVQDPDAEEADAETAGMPAGTDRTAIAASSLNPDSDERRVDVLLRGRVVSKFQAPVAGAKVWLDFGRGGQRGFGDRGGPGGPGGRNRRVPDPVVTDNEGRFAFQGRTFRDLRVILQVAHANHAPGVFDKNLGEAVAEMDVGDLVLQNGGVAIGRVTDLDGNAIAGATLRVSPENNNQLRWTRDREQLTPEQLTDSNGFYRLAHLPAGEWRITASAKMHVDGTSPTFAIEEDLQIEVEDIELGPGYDLAGFVTSAAGQPIAKAEVTLRSRGRDNNGGQNGPGGGRGGPGGGRGGPGGGGFGGGRDHRATTDDKGFFLVERLPGAPLEMTVVANGYLDHRRDGIDAKLGQKVYVTLQDGLKIVGTATDQPSGRPVTEFAVRAQRVRGLPVPGMENVDPAELMARMRDGNLDEATRLQLRQQMEATFAGRGRDGGGGPGGRGRGQGGPGGDQGMRMGDLGKPEHHEQGQFALTGLQEGVYAVAIQAPTHAPFRSQEVEVRNGAPAPVVDVTLDPGVSISGVVLDADQRGIADARVELRSARREDPASQANASDANGGRNGRGGRGGRMGEIMRQFGGGGATVVEARTDKNGRFQLAHAPRGTYRVRAVADGHSDASTDILDVQTDVTGIKLELGSLGTLVGKVIGVTEKNRGEARVVAVPAGSQGFNFRDGRPFADVQPDGTYRIENLAPGGYVVRAFVGSPRELMTELGPQFLDGGLQAEVTVAAGKTASHDVTLQLPKSGVVAGSVLHNGNAATGFQVALNRTDAQLVDASAGNEAGGGRGGRGGRGGFGGPGGGGRSFNASVGPSGRFSIEDVPEGNYRLTVSGGRRGTTLHEQQVQVFAQQTAELSISVQTSGLEGTVTADDNTPANELAGSIVLLPDTTALPADWNPRRGGGGNNAMTRMQNGAFKLESIKPGQYLLVLSVRGRERVTQSIFVAAGQTQKLQLQAGKKAADAPAPGNGPGTGGGNNGSAPAPRQRGPGGGNGPGGNGRGANGNPGQGGGRRGG